MTFAVNIRPDKKAERVRLWLPYPVSNQDQDVTNVDVKGNYDATGVYREPKFDNNILYAEWAAPRAEPMLSFAFDIERRQIVRKDFVVADDPIPPDVARFLTMTNKAAVCVQTPSTARAVTQGRETILAKAEAVYEYVVDNYRRDDTIIGCGAGKVSGLLRSRKGKCADIHSVFVALARQAGVPAREIFGIRMAEGDKRGDMTGAFHCRAEFYLPSYGWVPVDASDVLKLMFKEKLPKSDPKVKEARRFFFGAQKEDYIDFGSGRDLILNPRQEGPALNYFMYPYAEIDGRPMDYLSQKDLKYKVTFEEH